MFRICVLLLLTTLSHACLADWFLDPNASSLGFVSVKNGEIAEAHRFLRLSGSVSDEGRALVEIDLASVETSIPIRNERMQKMLFNTSKYPTAKISSDVDIEALEDLAAGKNYQQNLAFEVLLHGKKAKFSTVVSVSRINEQTYQITSQEPIILQAKQFGLLDGIEALREIAGLNAITPAVPVTFNLLFRETVPIL